MKGKAFHCIIDHFACDKLWDLEVGLFTTAPLDVSLLVLLISHCVTWGRGISPCSLCCIVYERGTTW